MLDKLSYKIRVQVVLGLFILVLVLAYHLSFKKTIEAYSSYDKYKNIETESQTDLNYGAVKRRFDILDSTYSSVQNSDYDRILINKITSLIGEYTVNLVSLKHVKVSNVLIDEITMKGTLNQLVKLVYVLEKEFYAGSILSTNFEIVKNKENKSAELNVILYLQRNDAHTKK